ncbi:MAG: hypothetical protein JSV80_02365 [Acidobacteriota bacterium]|nr:MAG: hypothetical protein JSV80_02365 [Acidobacteriota bacterium]
MTERATTLVALLLLVAALGVYLVHGLSFGLCIQDDAFISLRYARHLVEGQGLVYNVGERVEGYTNFSWTVLSALPFVLGADPVAALRVLGLLSGVLSVLAAAALAARFMPHAPLAAGAAGVYLASTPFLTAESVMGLETAAFAALCAAATAVFVGEQRAGARIPWSGAWLALAALTRPEGYLVGGLIGLFDLGRAVRERAARGAFLSRWALFLVPVSAHLVFRVVYYGDIVPNTFHAKVGGGWAALVRGSFYGLEYLWYASPLALLAVIGAGGLVAAGGSRRGGRSELLALVIPLVYIAYVVYVGGDFKLTFRFFAVPTIFLAALAGIGVEHTARLLTRAAATGWIVRALLIVLPATGLLALGGPARDFAAWRAQELPVHRAAGRWLGEHLSSDALLATGNAGVLPYESRLPTLDMFGLNDRHIALREMPSMGTGPPGHEKGDGVYVVDREPTVILIMRARFQPVPRTKAEIGQLKMSVSERELWADPRFHTHYELERVRLAGFYFHFFKRKEIA